MPVKNCVLHITYLLAQEEVEHIILLRIRDYELHSSGNNYLTSLIPTSTYPGTEGKPQVPTRSAWLGSLKGRSALKTLQVQQDSRRGTRRPGSTGLNAYLESTPGH